MNQMKEDAEGRLHEELLRTYQEASRHGYHATYFLQMLHEHGGRETAQRLLSSPHTQTGLFELYEHDLVPISVEAIVLKPEYRGLFDQTELDEAARRLDQLGYRVTNDGACLRK